MTRTPVDTAMRALSRSANKGRLWLTVATCAALVPGRSRRAAVRGMASLTVTSFTANVVLKPVFRRRRPDIDLTPLMRRLALAPVTTSFPSGHAASAAAFTTGVALEHPAMGAAVVPLAGAVAYSRMHVGVHHASDVLAGVALGTGIALASRSWWPVRPAAPALVCRDVRTPGLPRGEGLVVVVNPDAGDGPDPTAEIRRLLPAADIVELGPQVDLDAELDRRTRDAGGTRAVGVAGGDGTVSAVAAAALVAELPLAVFPAGTLNHFARDVGVETFADTARAVEDGTAVAVDVATAGGVPFLNTSSIGAYPQLVRRREQLQGRLGKWLAMAVATAEVLREGRPLRLRIDRRTADVWIVFVGNGEYTPRGPYPAWRPRLDDGQLDVRYLPASGPLTRTRAVLATLLGVTEHSSSYHAELAGSLRVSSLDGDVEIALDGEPAERAPSFEFAKLPGRLVVFRPHDSAA